MGRKASTINLSEDERLYLETQMRARTIQAQTVIRARILLLKAEGISVDHIADKVGMNRKSVMLCINKYLEGGVENALFDAPGRGRNAEITDDEKAWIINIACQKPVNLGYSAEVWTRALLTKHINKFAEEAGHTRLSTISQSKVRTILEEADIKPNKITYYCENRDPDFDQKMHNVLLVYKQLSLSDRTGHGDKREQIFYRNTNKLSLAFAGERSWRICFNGSLSVKRIELLYSVVKEHERRKSSFLYTALEKSRSVTNLQNFSLFLHHIGKESVILLSW